MRGLGLGVAREQFEIARAAASAELVDIVQALLGSGSELLGQLPSPPPNLLLLARAAEPGDSPAG